MEFVGKFAQIYILNNKISKILNTLMKKIVWNFPYNSIDKQACIYSINSVNMNIDCFYIK